MYQCHAGQLLFLSSNDRPVQPLDLVASLVDRSSDHGSRNENVT